MFWKPLVSLTKLTTYIIKENLFVQYSIFIQRNLIKCVRIFTLHYRRPIVHTSECKRHVCYKKCIM